MDGAGALHCRYCAETRFMKSSTARLASPWAQASTFSGMNNLSADSLQSSLADSRGPSKSFNTAPCACDGIGTRGVRTQSGCLFVGSKKRKGGRVGRKEDRKVGQRTRARERGREGGREGEGGARKRCRLKSKGGETALM